MQWLIFLFLPRAVLSEDERSKWVSLHAVLSGPAYTLRHLLKNLSDNKAHAGRAAGFKIRDRPRFEAGEKRREQLTG